MKLSVIIPCYNERHTIKEIIAAVIDAPYKDKEIIVVDDGSDDGTSDILKSCIQSKVNKIIFHDKNLGKGAAIRTGARVAAGDVIIIQDADLEYNPQEYPKLLEPIINGQADVVFGSRFVGNEPHRVLYFWHSFGNRLLTLISNMLTDLNLTDMETCYKAFRSEIIKSINIEENGFGFEPEITAKIAKTRCRIFEVGISYYGRTYTEGKKINWKDGLRAICCIVKYNVFRF